MMQPHRHPLRDRLRLAGEHPQRRVDAVGRRVQLRIEHDVAAHDRILGDAVAGEVERAALARRAALGRAILRMDRAHARRKPGRADDHRDHRLQPRRTAPCPVTTVPAPGSVNDRSTASRKRPVAPRARYACARPRTSARAARDTLAGHGRDRQDVGAREPVPRSAPAISRSTSARRSRRDEIDLGQRDDPAPDAEQIDDREVLARLRHHAVVGRDDQQHEVDAGRAGQHVVHELLVPGHVDEAERSRRPASAGRRSRGRSRCRAPSPLSADRCRCR